MEDVKNEKYMEAEELSGLEGCQQELQQVKERYLYLNAEFDNYKKRVEKDRLSWMDTAQDLIVLDVFSVVDDMERALHQLKVSELPAEAAVHLEGFEMIAKSLAKLLKKYDIEEIVAVKEFDPERFDAVMQTASEGHASGEIVSVLQKGYTRKGRVLRPAKVSVAA